jgi:hypothetical protein
MNLSLNQNPQVRLELQNMRKQKKKGSFKGKKNLEIHPKPIKKQKPRNSS